MEKQATNMKSAQWNEVTVRKTKSNNTNGSGGGPSVNAQQSSITSFAGVQNNTVEVASQQSTNQQQVTSVSKSSSSSTTAQQNNQINEAANKIQQINPSKLKKQSVGDHAGIYRLIQANQHYQHFGWELGSQREEDDNIRDDSSTFTSIVQQKIVEGQFVSNGNVWRLKRVDDKKNKYIIVMQTDQEWGQESWLLNAQIRYEDDIRGVGSGYVFLDDKPEYNYEWIIEESRPNTFKISLAEDTQKWKGIDMSGWILCAPRWGDKERDKEMKWMTLCFPGNTAETDKWHFIGMNEKLIEGASSKLLQPPSFIRQELQYEEGKLLIVNLDRDVPESEAKEIFGKYGEIVVFRTCVDQRSNLRNGKAWVLYKNNQQAERAVEGLDGLQLNGRNIEIKRSLKKGFVPADTTNFTSSTKFTGINPSSQPTVTAKINTTIAQKTKQQNVLAEPKPVTQAMQTKQQRSRSSSQSEDELEIDQTQNHNNSSLSNSYFNIVEDDTKSFNSNNMEESKDGSKIKINVLAVPNKLQKSVSVGASGSHLQPDQQQTMELNLNKAISVNLNGTLTVKQNSAQNEAILFNKQEDSNNAVIDPQQMQKLQSSQDDKQSKSQTSSENNSQIISASSHSKAGKKIKVVKTLDKCPNIQSIDVEKLKSFIKDNKFEFKYTTKKSRSSKEKRQNSTENHKKQIDRLQLSIQNKFEMLEKIKAELLIEQELKAKLESELYQNDRKCGNGIQIDNNCPSPNQYKIELNIKNGVGTTSALESAELEFQLSFQQIIFWLQSGKARPNNVFLQKEENAAHIENLHWIQVVFICDNEEYAIKFGHHFKDYFENTSIPEISEIHYFEAQNVYILALNNYIQD